MNIKEENEMSKTLISFYERKDLNLIIEDKQLVSEMSNLRPEESKLSMNIYITYDGTKINHAPRIKVQNNYNPKFKQDQLFSLTIEEEPRLVAGNTGEIKSKDLYSVLNFIKIYKDDLLDLWYMNISFEKFISIISFGGYQ